MSSLEYHNQLRRGLDSITVVSKALNSKTLELIKAEESIKGLKELSETYQRISNEAIKTLNETLSQTKIAETIRSKQIEELIKLNDDIQKAIGLKERIINGASVSNHTANALKEIQEERKREIKGIEKLKARVLEDYKIAMEDLSGIRTGIDQESLKLKILQDASEEIQMTQDERETYLNERDSQLSQKEKKLKKYEDRLIKYAEKLNITI